MKHSKPHILKLKQPVLGIALLLLGTGLYSYWSLALRQWRAFIYFSGDSKAFLNELHTLRSAAWICGWDILNLRLRWHQDSLSLESFLSSVSRQILTGVFAGIVVLLIGLFILIFVKTENSMANRILLTMQIVVALTIVFVFVLCVIPWILTT